MYDAGLEVLYLDTGLVIVVGGEDVGLLARDEVEQGHLREEHLREALLDLPGLVRPAARLEEEQLQGVERIGAGDGPRKRSSRPVVRPRLARPFLFNLFPR